MTQAIGYHFYPLLTMVLNAVEELASLPYIDIKVAVPNVRRKVFVSVLSVDHMVITEEHVFTFDSERSIDWNNALKERMMSYARETNRELAE